MAALTSRKTAGRSPRALKILWNHPRDHRAQIRLGALSDRTQECVFVKDQIVNDVTKLQRTLHRPICETLLRAPDELARTKRLRAETLRNNVLVQSAFVHLRVLAALLRVQFQ
jgi:hypothetical protein